VLPVSNDTLLRVVRRRAKEPDNLLMVIGIDDFAFRRNQRYGTIICDLERRQPVKLLPDREQATSQDWLKENPSIRIVARDRGGGYGEAAAKALPGAQQVADRWHLMENASRAFLDAVRKSMKAVRTALGATIINPALLTHAERLQYEGFRGCLGVVSEWCRRRQRADQADQHGLARTPSARTIARLMTIGPDHLDRPADDLQNDELTGEDAAPYFLENRLHSPLRRSMLCPRPRYCHACRISCHPALRLRRHGIGLCRFSHHHSIAQIRVSNATAIGVLKANKQQESHAASRTRSSFRSVPDPSCLSVRP
jgi:Transposase